MAGVALGLNYSLKEFSPQDVARIGDYYFRALHSIAEAPESRSGANLLSPEERRRLLVEWNATAREVPQASLTEVFEEQAARRPEAVAVEHGSTVWSYQTLKKRANELAAALAAVGFPAGSLVGLSLDRSAEMVASMVAILKAGGAYVPIDPSYPVAEAQTDARRGGGIVDNAGPGVRGREFWGRR